MGQVPLRLIGTWPLGLTSEWPTIQELAVH
jgi:hypothetical protein